MNELIELVFASKEYTPHGICLLWEPVLLWLFVASDMIIAVSYFSIPIALGYFVYQRKDLKYKWVFVLFSLFIFACGASHIMSIITIWKPLYALTGIVKALTALVSLITALLLWPLIPKVLQLPSPAHLLATNKDLEDEVTLHRHTKRALHDLNANLDREVELRTEELERQKEKYKVLLDTVADGVYGIDLDGRTIFANPAACKMFNASEMELIGQHIDSTINVCPNMKLFDNGKEKRTEKQTANMIMGAAEDSISNQEAVLCLRNSCFPVEFSRTPFKHDGKVAGYVVTFRDITEYKSAQSQLILSKNAAEVARKEAEVANQAKTQFLSRMSHELRTPLNAILGFAQLLEQDDLNEEQLDDVTEILAGGNHLLELINEVLELAKIESGKFEVRQERQTLTPIIKATMSLIRPVAEKYNVILINEMNPADDFHLIADNTRLKQVLVNLLSNAIKYNRENGTVTLSCQRRGERLRIKVTDTGDGMTDKQQENLFKPFERLGAENTNIEGTGIGLVITRHLVELMGGNIGVSSQKGEGSCFWVDMKLDDAAINSGEAA